MLFCNRLQKYLFQALRFKVKNKGVNGHNSSQEDLKMLMKLCGRVCPLFLRVYFAHSATIQNVDLLQVDLTSERSERSELFGREAA